MNKKAFEVSDALGNIDDALVSEAVRSSEGSCTAVKPKIRFSRIMTAAAALVLAAGTAVALPFVLGSGTRNITASVPTGSPDETDNGYVVISTKAPDYAAVTQDPVLVTDDPRVTQTPAPIGGSQVRFGSVSAIAMAISTGWYMDVNEVLHDLAAIYMPTKVPYGAELTDITVTLDTVKVKYAISEEWIHAESDPNRFVLIWHRTWTPEDIDTSGWPDGVFVKYSGNGLECTAKWVYDGCVFEIIVPGYYTSREDIIGFTGLVKVELDKANEHSPWEGFEAAGYMWLSDLDMGFSPLTAPAYSTVYHRPEGGDGSLVRKEGQDFLSMIPEDKRDVRSILKLFPCVGESFEPVLLENTTIVEINVYDVGTLKPIVLDISLEELREIAEHPAEHLDSSILELGADWCVLVDIVIVHNVTFIPELEEYETEAYHCGFVIQCGH
ncbi:MAG: hypothetical protein K6F68_00730 [Clostridiales bacterium]|nr:hypothetical protein [Clostridiales bacterium]